jgi:PAS domain-containing protein
MEGQTERAIRDQRLSVILDSLAEAVTIRARNDHIVYANQAALDRLGFDTVAGGGGG